VQCPDVAGINGYKEVFNYVVRPLFRLMESEAKTATEPSQESCNAQLSITIPEDERKNIISLFVS
jgi:hypothetical protein